MRHVIPVLLACSFILAGCHTSESDAGAGHAPHWSYEGATGPEHWADLDPAWAVARTGQRQSPIDLGGALAGPVATLTLDDQGSPLAIVNNGHTLQVNYAPGSSWTIGDERYAVKQFHFHTPSEHTTDGGRHAGMECHIVGANAAGELAVLGVLIEPGAANAFLASFEDHLPASPGATAEVATVRLSFSELLPPDRTRFRYEGSLTTPPCTEGVQWTVFAAPVEASPTQISRFEGIMGQNNRPTQPLHGRPLVIGP